MGSPGKMNQSDPEQSANQSLKLVRLISVIIPHCPRCGFSIATSLPPSVLFIEPSLLSLTFTPLLTFSLVFDSHFSSCSFALARYSRPSRFAIHLSRALHVCCVVPLQVCDDLPRTQPHLQGPAIDRVQQPQLQNTGHQ